MCLRPMAGSCLGLLGGCISVPGKAAAQPDGQWGGVRRGLRGVCPQVADEHGLESSLALPNAAAAPATAGAAAEANPDDDFSRRLAELKGR